MKKKLFLAATTLFLAGSGVMADEIREKTPAFPGAEGYGRYVTGGRGGKVYHVTNLNDSGEGSFRWACEQTEPRTIVFDVCGTIHLKSQLKLKHGDVTIAGQTAPGEGICLADWDFVISAPNVIIRYMRFRTSDTSGGEPDALGGMDGKNVMVDHCSVSWSVDECLSVYGNEHMTVQWCIISQSLRNSTHAKSAHGYGGNWGGKGATYHHNLLAHHDSRTPRLGNRPKYVQQDTTDLRNNVMYNWAGNGCYGGEGMKVNFVNNYYKPGPGTDSRSSGSHGPLAYRICGVGISTKPEDGSYNIWGKYFVDGNANPDYPNLINKNWEMGIYPQISTALSGVTKDTMRLHEPLPFIYVTTHTAEQAYERVLDYAGCSLERDWVDELVISDVRNRKATYTGSGNGNHPGIIDSPYDLRPAGADATWTPWPVLEKTRTYVDADGDGMDDTWEVSQGLNPASPTDGNKLNNEGYTMLEVYLNSLVAHITEGQNAGGTPEGYIEYYNPNEGVISIPVSNIDLELGQIVKASDGKKKAVIKDGKADCFSNNDHLIFDLYNHTPGVYAVKFGAATIRDDFKLCITLTDVASGEVESEQTVTITNTGDWQQYSDYTVETAALSAGLKKMDITFYSSTGQYTGNLQNLSVELVKAVDGIRPVKTDKSTPHSIYTLDGRNVGRDVNALQPGIYLIDGRKVIVR